MKNEDGDQQVQTKEEPRSRWLFDRKLNVNIHPVDWMNAMLPSYNEKKKSTITPHQLSIETM